MKRLLLVLAACGGGEDKPAPASTKTEPKETITAQLVGCSPALAAPIDPRESIWIDGRAPGFGTGSGGGFRPSANTPRVTLPIPSATGDLRPELVRRYLRRRLPTFQYCFEKELLVDPKLAGGTVEATFAILSSGAVTGARADGIKPIVARCIANAIGMVEFPKPPDGNQVQVTQKIEIAYTPPASAGSPPPPPRRPARIPVEWTPFAADAIASEAVAKPVADALVKEMQTKLAAVEACFDGARGVVRVIFAIYPFEKKVRAGGIGDSKIESCIANAVGAYAVAQQTETVEIACDFARGGDAPLRVSPDAGYNIAELTATELRNRDTVRTIPPRGGQRATTLDRSASILIVAEPDAPGHGVEFALWWAPPGSTLVAVKASGGAPVFVGMGDSRAERAKITDRRVVQLRTSDGQMTACIGDVKKTAKLLDPREMDRAIAAIKEQCGQTPCESTVVIGTSGDFIAKDLVATTSAARRGGFHALSIGGPACD